MVTLRNIRRVGNEIETDYYPEGGKEKFHMKVNILNGKVIEHDGKPYSMSPPHVKSALIKIAKLENIPEEKTLIWY